MSDYELSPLVAVLGAAEESSQKGNPAAAGAFNVNFFTQAQGVLEGLRRGNAPAVIQASKGANRFQGGPDKIFYMVTKAMENSDHQLPVALHLDHGNPEKGEECADSGYTGIMIDASDEEFPVNIAITRGMVAFSHPRGVGVEGEYGQLSGVEEDVSHQETVYADPARVPEFFERTGADALAVAYGTSHGPNKGANINELKTTIVRDSYAGMVEAGLNETRFLVGHGSSTVPQDIVQEINDLGGNLQNAQGVPLEKIKEGISFGLRKINIDTDLRLGITATSRKFFKDNPAAGQTKALAGAKKVLDEQLDVIDPRTYLGEVEPFDILREPPEESGVQEFIDLMALIKERIAQHVEFLVNEFGSAGIADMVADTTMADMKAVYEQNDPW
ncbi:MAG: class II fructose-bisphosphate aldolase [Candidatus Brocadiia bacterium]